MKAPDFIRELLYPLTETTIVIAMIFFWILFLIVGYARVLGIWLAILVFPAYLRYLLYLLQARATGGNAPVPAIEMFNPADSLWTLTPLIFVALLIWAELLLGGTGYGWLAIVIRLLIVFVVPASLGILAITHSPTESLNPAAIARMIRVCGTGYFLVPATVIALALVFELLLQLGVSPSFLEIGNSYQVFILFTLTGALLHARDIAFEVEIDLPVEANAEEVAGDLEKERQRVASHAYGFISRGNRESGFAHILDWVGKEADVDAASAWFFAEMMTWETKEPALFYAQIYLAHLLHHEQDSKALKLMATCLHQDPAWKPKTEDRAHAIALAKKHRRTDVLKQLGN